MGTAAHGEVHTFLEVYRTGLLLRAPLLRTCWVPLRLGEFALKSWSACHTAGSGWNWQGWVVEPAVFRDLDDHAGQMRVRGGAFQAQAGQQRRSCQAYPC